MQMRSILWPEADLGEHRREADQFFAGHFPRGPWAVFMAEDPTGKVVGFVEVSVRPYAEGCSSAQVAYLEGWFVQEPARRSGMGRSLVDAAAAWGRARGCQEFASDAEVDNEVSRAAHCALGFADVGVVRCFRMRLAHDAAADS